MELTNKERWQSYTSGLASPQSYIDWSWLYLISAALQRRVWLGPEHQQCFANQYTIFVGAPGIGKGLVIREVSNFLKHWKLSDRIINVEKLSQDEKITAQAVADTDLETQQKQELQSKSEKSDIIQPGLIAVAADATTYEALVQAVADSFLRINYVNNEGKLKIYGHSSLCFSLQELASLMRKRTDDTVNYLLGLYDCPLDYEYVTKTKGKDRVRKGCINMLAGTTPSFMQSTFDEKLAGEGFTSRVFFIYASKNRKNQFFIPALTEEQKRQKVILLEHIRKLTALYGQAQVDTETWDWLQSWWDNYEKNKQDRANKSIKMIPYYSRKNIHVMKIAMALHFGESTDMFIPKDTFKKAMDILEREEKFMHLAITLEEQNPEAKCARKIMELLATGPKNFVDIYTDCYGMLNQQGIEKSLAFLCDTEQTVVEQKENETTGQTINYWRLK